MVRRAFKLRHYPVPHTVASATRRGELANGQSSHVPCIDRIYATNQKVGGAAYELSARGGFAALYNGPPYLLFSPEERFILQQFGKLVRICSRHFHQSLLG